MLARIILTALQIALSWVFAPMVRAMIPLPAGQLDMFVLALIFAVMIWLIGVVVTLVLPGAGRPSMGTLSASIVMALAGAAMTWIPPLTNAVDALMNTKLSLAVYPMAGALIGYFARR